MPRKTPPSGGLERTARLSFNEAAARCRGKLILTGPMVGLNKVLQ